MTDKRVAGIAFLCSLIMVVGVQIVCALIGCCRADCGRSSPCPGGGPVAIVPMPPMIAAGAPGNLLIIGPECCPPILPEPVRQAYHEGIAKLDRRCHELAGKAKTDLKAKEEHLRTALRRDLLKLSLFRREKGHRAIPGATEALLRAKAAEAIHLARVEAKADDGAVADAEYDTILTNIALQEAILAAALGPGWLPAAGTMVFTGNLTDGDLQGLLTLELDSAPAAKAPAKPAHPADPRAPHDTKLPDNPKK